MSENHIEIEEQEQVSLPKELDDAHREPLVLVDQRVSQDHAVGDSQPGEVRAERPLPGEERPHELAAAPRGAERVRHRQPALPHSGQTR